MDIETQHCRFEHPGFATLGDVVFRLTRDDKVPALVLQMEGTDVVVPLRAIAQLFELRPDSPDGRMLHLVEQGLRFMPQLRLGDALPAEVLTGEASWDPLDYHLQAAKAKLQLQLVNWIGGGESDGQKLTCQMLVASMDDPSIRRRVHDALGGAAERLGVDGGGDVVAGLIEELGREMSYFEALRERLLDRAHAMLDRMTQASQELASLGQGRRETLFQVGRLTMLGVADLDSRFEEIDCQVSEIGPALRNLEQQRTFLRPNRDRLYCTLLAWEPLLSGWARLPKVSLREPEGVWRLIDETYRFMAPRYMTVQSWQVAAMAEKAERARATLVW